MYIYIHTNIYIYIHIYINTYIYIYVYIYIFERNEITDCPRKPREPISIGITWHTVFLPLVCLVFLLGDSQFYEDHTFL